jgi:signal peptide peptidase SppA
MPDIILNVDPQNLIRHFEQYMGMWAIDETFMNSALSQIAGMNIVQHISEFKAAADNGGGVMRDYTVVDGVAVIEIRGAMTKYGSSMSAAPSSIESMNMLRRAARDDKAKSILMLIDSPGGTVAGTGDLAQAVSKARQSKKVYAYIEDLGASAAYWVASQADKVFANPSASIGNIGTYMMLKDYSRADENAGIKTVVIKAGEFKAIGIPGAPVTEEQRAELQRLVEDVNGLFVSAVKSGRKLNKEQLAAVANGRVFIGAQAQAVGLIDGIADLSDVMEMAQNKRTKGNRRMDEQDTKATTEGMIGTLTILEPATATYADIKAACIGANAEFLCGQLEKKATIDEATSAWMVEQNSRIEAAAAKADKPGLQPLVTTKANPQTETPETGAASFDIGIREGMAQGLSRKAAILKAAKANPEAYKAYLQSTNPAHVQHLLQ